MLPADPTVLFMDTPDGNSAIDGFFRAKNDEFILPNDQWVGVDGGQNTSEEKDHGVGEDHCR